MASAPRYSFKTPTKALRFLQEQQRGGRMEHDIACAFREALNNGRIGLNDARFVDDGSCARCAAWRALGFTRPRDVL
jgi:hypothetical protein